MSLPHKAQVGDIIVVKGYLGKMFLVTEWTEEIMHVGDGTTEETVTYTGQNIDNYKDVKIIFDQDVDRIVVPAHQSDAFIRERQGREQSMLPEITSKDAKLNNALLKHYQEMQAKKRAKQEPPKSIHEQVRQREQEAKEYLDYLLDSHSMLMDLENMLGEDETRQEEMRLIQEEFEKKSKELVEKGLKGK